MQKESTLFMKNIDNLPIWAKQVVVSEFIGDIEKKIQDMLHLLKSKKLFQYVEPTLSILGKTELAERSHGLSEGCYIFMEDVANKYSIFDITVKNNWSLADTVKIFVKLFNLEFIKIPQEDSETNMAIALFIAGEIRIGEFLKKLGKINSDQLEQALRYQKQLNDEGRHIKMASILIKLGFITNEGLDSLLMYKEESKRRIPVSIGLTSIKFDNAEYEQNHARNLQREIARLENENAIMKKRLKTLLNLD